MISFLFHSIHSLILSFVLHLFHANGQFFFVRKKYDNTNPKINLRLHLSIVDVYVFLFQYRVLFIYLNTVCTNSPSREIYIHKKEEEEENETLFSILESNA